MRGVGSDGLAQCGDVLLFQVSIWAVWVSVVRGPYLSGWEQRWICNGELTPRQLAASEAA